MLRTLRILALLAASASTLACSSSSSGGSGCDTGGANGGTCTAGQTQPFHSCADLTQSVSFKSDIQPIFNMSCAIAGSTCHGDPALQKMESKTGQVWLGLPVDAGAPDSSAVLMGIVGVKSPENPGMDLVAPGDPGNSYLMHKLDYDECQYASACNATSNSIFANCGLGMPYNAGTLDIPTRDKIRAWIAQGAKNN